MHPAPTSSPGPVLTERGRATRERILCAAAALMHRQGVAGTSLDDVRAATGTSKSQLYHYFADKSALVAAVAERQVQQVLDAQEPELGAIDSLAGLRRWRDRVLALHSGPERSGCPMGRLATELADSDPVARTALAEGFTVWQNRLAAGLRRIQRAGDLGADPDRLAAGLLAALQGGILLTRTHGSVAPLQAALDLALDGAASRITQPPPTGDG